MNVDCLWCCMLFFFQRKKKSHDFVDCKESAFHLLSYQHVGQLMLFSNQECIVKLLFLAVKGHQFLISSTVCVFVINHTL